MEKMDGQSKDILADNINKLKELFPEAFSEGQIDFDSLKELLGEYVNGNQERYDFTWNGKSQARMIAQTPSTGTLRPCKEESVNWDTTQNIFIEGDNLEVLKLLQKTYHKKIKMIYIDPPYNTGKDFVYKDNFKDNIKNYKQVTGQVDGEGRNLSTNAETSGRYHTDWLNMIYPRLKLARNLLRDDGVIFISIDDNEVHNLRKVCDEIFGEENFVGSFAVNSTPNARDYGHIGKMHENLLFYCKDYGLCETNLLPIKDKVFKYKDDKGGFNIHPLYNSNEAFHKNNRPNLYYPFYLNKNKCLENEFYEISLEKSHDNVEIYPPKSQKNNIQFVWRWGKEKAESNLNGEIIGYKTNDGEYRIIQKMRSTQKLIRSLLIEKEYSSRKGTAEIEELFNGKAFSFPKPLALMHDIIRVGMSPSNTILDFFAGSGTTAHAVMQLNAEDGGNRRCISVQLPETTDETSEAHKAGYATIAEITKERIRRAGKKIQEENPDYEGDLGFKVFKLDSSNIRPWDGDFDLSEADLIDMIDNIKHERTPDDVLYEILLKYGLDLTLPISEHIIEGQPVYNVGMGALIICLAPHITLPMVEQITALKDELKPEIMRVVFKDAGFKDDVVKTNAMQILKQANIEDVRSL